MIPKRRNTFLGEILVQAGLLTEEGLARGLEAQTETGQLLGEALIGLGLVTPEDIEWALSSQYQLPFVRPTDVSVDRAARDLIPEPLAREYHIAPLFRTGEELSVVIDDPLKIESLSALEALEGVELNIALATPEDVRRLIDDLYGPMPLEVMDGDRPALASSRLAASGLEAVLRDYSGRRLMEFLLARGVSHRATSIHLEPGPANGEIRIRAGAEICESFTVRPDWYRTLVERIGSLVGRGPGDPARALREGVGRIELENGREIVFSAAFSREGDGRAVVLRLPVGSPALPALEDLRLPEGAVEKIALLLARGSGLWIVSGAPAGASSRILHALVQPVLAPGRRVLSLREDSRAYAGLATFRGLDVRDGGGGRIPTEGDWDGVVLPTLFQREEIVEALRFSLGGRTVLATMEFPDSRAVLRFLLCHGINVGLLVCALSGILVQKEIRVLCRHCKEPLEEGTGGGPPPLPESIVGPGGGAGGGVRRFRPVGCSVCRSTGFESRETLLGFQAMDARLRKALLGPDPLAGLEEAVAPDLGRTCLERFRRGDTTLEDVLSVCEI